MAQASWVNLVEHLLWPITVIVLVVVLRRQIGDFLSAVGGRITHVSVMSVTVELAVATETTLRVKSTMRGSLTHRRFADSFLMHYR